MDFWEKLLSVLENGKKACLLYVIQSEGSSPGRVGFKQFVTLDGEMFGSIGGGPMEQKLIESAKTHLKSGFGMSFLKRQIHRNDVEKDKSGMICSGEQTVVFYFLNSQHITILREIQNSISNNSNGILELTESGIAFISNKCLANQFEVTIKDAFQWKYCEQINYHNTICIIGGGHVGLALSQIMNQLGFRVELFDNRKDLNTIDQNIFAHEKHIVSYDKIADYIPEGNNIYVVLMSFGFKTDELILHNIISKNFKYLGMMGSSEKVTKLFSNLKDDGFSQKDISKVHSPIGIPIHSKTPGEIAISIAAEIVKVKNKP